MQSFVQDGQGSVWSAEFLASSAFVEFINLIPEAAIFSNREGGVILSNKVAQDVFGYSKQEFNEINVEDLVPEKIKDIHPKMREMFFDHPEPRFLEGRDLELFAVKKDGSHFPMEAALFAIRTDQGLMAVNLIRDVSERQASQAEIESFAFVDALTNLPNRRYFDTNGKRNAAKAKRHDHGLGLLFVDLDKFKPINDNEGHAVGDEVLKAVSARLSVIARDEDFVARVGGDEFVVMVYPAQSAVGLEGLAKRLLDALQEPVMLDGKRYDVSASIGISFQQGEEIDLPLLIERADKAMYQSKSRNGNCYTLFSE